MVIKKEFRSVSCTLSVKFFKGVMRVCSGPIVLCVLIIWISGVQAQNIVISGEIVDQSNDQPLSYANIIYNYHNSETKEVEFSDELGAFELIAPHNVGDSLFLEVSYLGYKKERKTILIEEAKEYFVKISMISAHVKVDEIIITDSFPPVVVKEDTIIYNIKEFVDGTEFKLRDVLKKTPGFEVTKEDEIYYFGEKVNELLVENERFFTGGTELGVRYLPARVVSKIEVLEKYNRIGSLRGTGQGDRLAVNIHLDKEQDRFVFGDGLTRSNGNSRHRLNSNLFYYSPSTRLNSIWDFQSSIDNESGSINLFNVFGLSVENLDPLSLKGDRVNIQSQMMNSRPNFDQNNLFGIVHLTQKISNHMKLNFVGNATRRQERMQSQGDLRYYEIDMEENIENLDSIRKSMQFYDIELVYDRPDKGNYFSYDFNYGNSPYQDRATESYLLNETTYDKVMHNRVRKESFYQDIKWVKKWNDNWNHLVNVKWNYSDQSDENLWNAEGDKIPALYEILGNQIKVKHQESVQNENIYLLSQFDHRITRNNILKGFYRFDKAISRGEVLDEVDNFENAVPKEGFTSLFNTEMDLNTHYQVGALHFERRVKEYAFTGGIEAHMIRLSPGDNLQTIKTKVRPRFYFSTTFENLGRLTMGYNYRYQSLSEQYFWQDLYLRNFNNVGMGNLSVFHQSEDRFHIQFSLANKMIGNSFSIGVQYNMLHDPVFNRYVFEENYYTTQPYNNQKPSRIGMTMINYIKQISRWRISSTTIFTKYNRHTYNNGKEQSLHQFSLHERFGLMYNGKNVEVAGSYNGSINRIPSVNGSSTWVFNHRFEPGIKMFISDHWTLSSEFYLNFHHRKNSKQDHYLWNIRTQYIIADRHKIELIGYNILNHTSLIRNQFDPQYFSSIEDRLFPRYVSIQYIITF